MSTRTTDAPALKFLFAVSCCFVAFTLFATVFWISIIVSQYGVAADGFKVWGGVISVAAFAIIVIPSWRQYGREHRRKDL
jgi:hypothetical protein